MLAISDVLLEKNANLLRQGTILVDPADEGDPNAEIKVSVEIQATFPNGAKDQTKRAVSENARTLGFKNADWE